MDNVFSARELVRAVELMISKSDIRQDPTLCMAMLRHMGFSAADIRETITAGKYLDFTARGALGIVSLRPRKKKREPKFEDLSMDELKRGVELLVSPCELCERNILTNILKALDFIPQDVLDQIKDGTPLNAGPVLNLEP